MKTLTRAVGGAMLLAALAFAPASASAKDVTVGNISVSAPWTRATPKGARVAGGFLTITNRGKEPDRLIGGSFPLAGKFEVHEMAMDHGIMKMRHLANGLEIKPGETITLKPGSYHVMFMDLKEQVQTGKPIAGTLVSQKAGTVHIEYAVAPIGTRAAPGAKAAPAGTDHGGMDHGGMKMNH